MCYLPAVYSRLFFRIRSRSKVLVSVLPDWWTTFSMKRSVLQFVSRIKAMFGFSCFSPFNIFDSTCPANMPFFFYVYLFVSKESVAGGGIKGPVD